MSSTDMPFSHMNAGTEVRVEVHGKECRLVLVTHSSELAHSLAENLLQQLLGGVVFIKIAGKPTGIREEIIDDEPPEGST